MLRSTFALLDLVRQQAGRALDAAGLGPTEAPFRILMEAPGARVRAYNSPDATSGPVLLIIPAPIKRAYIWDLLPEVSVVRHCLRRGLRTYVLEWLDPGLKEDAFGLADYADRLPAFALNAIAAEAKHPKIVLAGHSLGGTLAAVFAGLHPGRTRGLVLLDAPLAFGREGGPLARVLATMPHARVLRTLAGSPLPGSFIGLLSAAAVPEVIVLQRWADLGASLGDRLASAIHARVERWTLDELAMPGALFEDVVEQLYREDQYMAGRLEIDGRRTGPAQLRSPVMAVVNPLGGLVPPSSMLAALDAAAVPWSVLRYEGDRGPGFQHLGPLIAPVAHARLWPRILDWIHAL